MKNLAETNIIEVDEVKPTPAQEYELNGNGPAGSSFENRLVRAPRHQTVLIPILGGQPVANGESPALDEQQKRKRMSSQVIPLSSANVEIEHDAANPIEGIEVIEDVYNAAFEIYRRELVVSFTTGVLSVEGITPESIELIINHVAELMVRVKTFRELTNLIEEKSADGKWPENIKKPEILGKGGVGIALAVEQLTPVGLYVHKQTIKDAMLRRSRLVVCDEDIENAAMYSMQEIEESSDTPVTIKDKGKIARRFYNDKSCVSKIQIEGERPILSKLTKKLFNDAFEEAVAKKIDVSKVNEFIKTYAINKYVNTYTSAVAIPEKTRLVHILRPILPPGATQKESNLAERDRYFRNKQYSEVSDVQKALDERFSLDKPQYIQNEEGEFVLITAETSKSSVKLALHEDLQRNEQNLLEDNIIGALMFLSDKSFDHIRRKTIDEITSSDVSEIIDKYAKFPAAKPFINSLSQLARASKEDINASHADKVKTYYETFINEESKLRSLINYKLADWMDAEGQYLLEAQQSKIQNDLVADTYLLNVAFDEIYKLNDTSRSIDNSRELKQISGRAIKLIKKIRHDYEVEKRKRLSEYTYFEPTISTKAVLKVAQPKGEQDENTKGGLDVEGIIPFGKLVAHLNTQSVESFYKSDDYKTTKALLENQENGDLALKDYEIASQREIARKSISEAEKVLENFREYANDILYREVIAKEIWSDLCYRFREKKREYLTAHISPRNPNLLSNLDTDTKNNKVKDFLDPTESIETFKKTKENIIYGFKDTVGEIITELKVSQDESSLVRLNELMKIDTIITAFFTNDELNDIRVPIGNNTSTFFEGSGLTVSDENRQDLLKMMEDGTAIPLRSSEVINALMIEIGKCIDPINVKRIRSTLNTGSADLYDKFLVSVSKPNKDISTRDWNRAKIASMFYSFSRTELQKEKKLRALYNDDLADVSSFSIPNCSVDDIIAWMRYQAHVKTLHDELRSRENAVHRDVEMTRRLDPAKTQTVLDSGHITLGQSTYPFVLLEYLHGNTWIDSDLPFMAYIKPGGMFDQGLESLISYHQRGIIHGDVKPANFISDKDGENTKLTDNGMANTPGNGYLTAQMPFGLTDRYYRRAHRAMIGMMFMKGYDDWDRKILTEKQLQIWTEFSAQFGYGPAADIHAYINTVLDIYSRKEFNYDLPYNRETASGQLIKDIYEEAVRVLKGGNPEKEIQIDEFNEFLMKSLEIRENTGMGIEAILTQVNQILAGEAVTVENFFRAINGVVKYINIWNKESLTVVNHNVYYTVLELWWYTLSDERKKDLRMQKPSQSYGNSEILNTPIPHVPQGIPANMFAVFTDGYLGQFDDNPKAFLEALRVAYYSSIQNNSSEAEQIDQSAN